MIGIINPAEITIMKNYLYTHKKETLLINLVIIFILFLLIIYIIWSSSGSKIPILITPPVV